MVNFTNFKADPQITNFAVYNIEGVNIPAEIRNDRGNFYDGIARKQAADLEEDKPVQIGAWDINSFSKSAWKEMSFELTEYIKRIGQYEVKFSSASDLNNSGLEFKDWEMEMYGTKMKSAIELLKDGSTFRITRSQLTLDEFPSIFRVKIKYMHDESSGKITIWMLTF
jgi:alpha-L-fucosidase